MCVCVSYLCICVCPYVPMYVLCVYSFLCVSAHMDFRVLCDLINALVMREEEQGPSHRRSTKSGMGDVVNSFCPFDVDTF